MKQVIQRGIVAAVMAAGSSLLMFGTHAHAGGIYHPLCEKVEKQAEKAKDALDHCLVEITNKKSKLSSRDSCKVENEENLQALKEVEKCRYENNILTSDSK